jgi:hypothetical protein
MDTAAGLLQGCAEHAVCWCVCRVCLVRTVRTVTSSAPEVHLDTFRDKDLPSYAPVEICSDVPGSSTEVVAA